MMAGCSSVQPQSNQKPDLSAAKREYLLGSVCLAVLALGVCLPFVVRSFPQGDDFPFHAGGWIDVLNHWRQGTLFPAWNGLQAYGLGEPTYLFYPPLSLYLGALITWIFGATSAPAVFSGVCVLIAGMCMRSFASDTLDVGGSWIAGLLYAGNPYLLLDLWIRNAFAESLAIALFPLVLKALTRLRDLRTAINLALAFALIFFCNLPSAVIVGYTIALVVTTRAVIERQWRVLLYGVLGTSLAAIFSAVVILPALGNQKFVQIATLQAFDPRYFLPTRGSLFSVAMLLFCVIALWAQIAGRVYKAYPNWRSLFIISNVVALLLIKLSAPVYATLPMLSKIQFPFRWLLVLSAIAVVMLVASDPCVRLRRKIGFTAVGTTVTAVLVLVFVALSSHLNASLTAGKRIAWGSEQSSAMVMRPVGEYLPIGTQNSSGLKTLSEELQRGFQANSHLTIRQWSIERRTLLVTSDETASLRLPLLFYPGWHATIDAKPVLLTAIDGMSVVQVPAGRHTIELTFQSGRFRLVGFCVSLISLIIASAYLTCSAGRFRRYCGDAKGEPV